MDRMKKSLWILLGTLTMTAVGCGSNGGGGSSSSSGAEAATATRAPVVFEGTDYKILEPQSSQKSSIDHNAHKAEAVVCDPFGTGGSSSGLRNGASAQLYWLDNQCPRYNEVEDLIAHAHQSTKELFFTDLFTPTRLFDKGFSTQTSEPVKDDQGNLLIEWFALKFKFSIRLPDGMPEGQYELATLSDDSSILRVKVGDDMSTLVDNGDVHMTRMGCSSRFVTLSKSSSVDFELLYAQGPRYHIANVLLFRHISKTSGVAGRDSECGRDGNDRYFDPDHDSAPQGAYQGLLDRGWNPVPSTALVVPNNDYNPCHEGVAPVVSNFRVLEATLTDVIVAWETDIPATTQLRWTNPVTGEVRVSDSDNRLRTSHSMWISSLSPDTAYAVEVLATSEDNGHSVAGPFTARTAGGGF